MQQLANWSLCVMVVHYATTHFLILYCLWRLFTDLTLGIEISMKFSHLALL